MVARTASPAPARSTGNGKISGASPPEHMSDTAQEIWRGVIGVLAESGMLRDVDLLAVEMLCEAYADFATADQELRNNWVMMERSDGSQIPMLSRYTYKVDGFGNKIATLHPAYSAKRDASNAIRQWLSELGMTPAARARIVGSVHGLPPGERAADGDETIPIGEMAFDDLGTEDREAMRQILQRRLAGSLSIAAPSEEVE